MAAVGMTGPRVFFYVQHLLGIGHIARASRIASAMAKDGCHVTIVSGGIPVPGFPADDVESVTLPALVAGKAGFSALADENGNPVGDDFLSARRDLLLDAYRRISPDVVIVEAFPFGRRQMRFELLPLIDAIEASSPRPKLFSSVRDILQEQKKPGRDEETVSLLKAHFDGILVHGDPTFVRLEETFALTPQIADKVIYTGLVAPPTPSDAPDSFDIVVSAGGGAVGRELISTALDAARLVATDRRWCVVTGPNLPQNDFEALRDSAPPNAELFRFRKDFPSLLKGAQLSISQAGYNTVCDLLVAGCRPILIPFTAGGETEQSLRAARLQDLGLAYALPEAGLTVDMLCEAIKSSLAMPPVRHDGLDLKGSARTAYIVRNAIELRDL